MLFERRRTQISFRDVCRNCFMHAIDHPKAKCMYAPTLFQGFETEQKYMDWLALENQEPYPTTKRRGRLLTIGPR